MLKNRGGRDPGAACRNPGGGEAAAGQEGVELDIKVFSDYVQPNLQLNDKQLDANFFQHKPYLESFNKDRKATLVPVALVHVEPFGGYSKKIKNVSELKDGATIAIPNDPSTAAAPWCCCRSRAWSS